MALEEDKLKDEDVLAIILSSFSGERVDRDVLTRVLYNEENPEEGEVQEILKGRNFTKRPGFEARPLSIAWMQLSRYLWVEPVGHDNDYLVNHSVLELLRDFRERERISQEDFDYLAGLREKYIQEVW